MSMKIKLKGNSVILETDYLGGESDQNYFRRKYHTVFGHMRHCGIEELDIHKNDIGYHESFKQSLIREAAKTGHSKGEIETCLVYL